MNSTYVVLRIGHTQYIIIFVYCTYVYVHNIIYKRMTLCVFMVYVPHVRCLLFLLCVLCIMYATYVHNMLFACYCVTGLALC